LRNRLWSLAILLALSACSFAASGEDSLIRRMRAQLSSVRDYRCDVRLDASLPGLSVSNMRMTLYFKRPGKIHIAAKEGFALLPREGLFLGDPVDEVLQRFELTALGDARWDGALCAKYALRPRQDASSPMGSLRLYVDRERMAERCRPCSNTGGFRAATGCPQRRRCGCAAFPLRGAVPARGPERTGPPP